MSITMEERGHRAKKDAKQGAGWVMRATKVLLAYKRTRWRHEVKEKKAKIENVKQRQGNLETGALIK